MRAGTRPGVLDTAAEVPRLESSRACAAAAEVTTGEEIRRWAAVSDADTSRASLNVGEASPAPERGEPSLQRWNLGRPAGEGRIWVAAGPGVDAGVGLVGRVGGAPGEGRGAVAIVLKSLSLKHDLC